MEITKGWVMVGVVTEAEAEIVLGLVTETLQNVSGSEISRYGSSHWAAPGSEDHFIRDCPGSLVLQGGTPPATAQQPAAPAPQEANTTQKKSTKVQKMVMNPGAHAVTVLTPPIFGGSDKSKRKGPRPEPLATFHLSLWELTPLLLLIIASVFVLPVAAVPLAGLPKTGHAAFHRNLEAETNGRMNFAS